VRGSEHTHSVTLLSEALVHYIGTNTRGPTACLVADQGGQVGPTKVTQGSQAQPTLTRIVRRFSNTWSTGICERKAFLCHLMTINTQWRSIATQ
jgi:hypothetical protein